MNISFDQFRFDEHLKAIANHAVAVESVLAELDEQSELLRTEWDGQAKRAYESMHAQWSWTMFNRRALLENAASAARSAAEILVCANTEVTKKWESLSKG
ncbi:WXG100 family type VII secretion target [Microbacterium sp. PRF11]|uniref:WXG100 family type VII secretion target n=1 Tax=Microbacterium sp. PRF11 TaxID=2962593 RepID=UPI002880F299|nr:WXG100 family type VII secretion target [Microbacterium sp. PRF11]MDT0117746.1 WXG100 family type VII secretion target [Microbacterium sp. PRF11]